MTSVTTEVPPGFLPHQIRHHADRSGGNVAVRFLDDHGKTATWTYGELWERTTAIAATLIEHGVGPGDRVAMVMPPTIHAISGFYGVQLARAIAVPACYPSYAKPMPRLRSIVEDCDPAAILSVDGCIDRMADRSAFETSATPIWIAADRAITPMDESGVREALTKIEAADLGLLQYTSGSTSEPKGVRVTQGNLRHNIGIICDAFGLVGAGIAPPQAVFWLPFFHDMGLIGGILTPLCIGGTTTLMSPQSFLQSPIRWLEAIDRYRANVSGAPSFAYQLAFDRIAPSQADRLDLSSWQTAFCGAEPIQPRSLHDFARRFAANGFKASAFYPCYGLAEATLLVSGGRAVEADGSLKCIEVDRHGLEHGRAEVVSRNRFRSDDAEVRSLFPCGSPLGDIELRIVQGDDHNGFHEADAAEVGEIWVRSESVADGYWKSTEAANSDNGQLAFEGYLSDSERPYLRTGDLGFLFEHELYVTGRLKDSVIIRGRNVYPVDIEQSIRSHIQDAIGSVAAFAVSGVRGEAIGLAVEVRQSGDAMTNESLVRTIRRVAIENHDVDPHDIWLLRRGQIPLTTSGKIRRGECRRRSENQGWQRVEHHYRGAQIASQVPLAMPELAGDAEVADETTIRAAVRDWFERWMVVRAGVPSTDIDSSKPLIEYGLDSMMAVEMSGEIEAWSGIPLSPMAAWDYPTIDALAGFVTAQVVGTESFDGPKEPSDQHADASWAVGTERGS